ncbi:MAG: hypothetical protein II721_00130, partial [Bacilli bacterium]|nr:hypothetical protein [Bacilli bacterium]
GKANGILLHPCLPKEMDGYVYERKFGAKSIKISVIYGDNEELKVNGKVIKGRFAPIEKEIDNYEVQLTLQK